MYSLSSLSVITGYALFLFFITYHYDYCRPTSPMPSNYYVSPPKAMIELEIRKFGDTSPLTQGIGDNDTLAQKKVSGFLIVIFQNPSPELN